MQLKQERAAGHACGVNPAHACLAATSTATTPLPLETLGTWARTAYNLARERVTGAPAIHIATEPRKGAK